MLLKYFFGRRAFTFFDLIMYGCMCVLLYKGSIGVFMFIILCFVADLVSAAMQLLVEK